MKDRLSKVRSSMVKHRLDAVLISSVPNITYLTNISHFSKEEREAFLFVTTDKQYILTDGRYSEAVKNKIKDFKLIEISPKLTFEKCLKLLIKKHKIKKVGAEQDNLTVKEHKTLDKYLNDIYHLSVSSLRLIKDRNEIISIQDACKLGDATFKYIFTKIKEGVSEKQLSIEIEFFIKKHGADISFPPIVAFGKNSAYPHHKTSNEPLSPIFNRHSGKPKAHLFEPEPQSRRPESLARGDSGQALRQAQGSEFSRTARMTSGQFVFLDFGVKLNNYCSDMTRTVFFGKPSSEQKKMYQTVLDAQKKAIEHLVTHLGGGRMDSSEVKLRGIKASEVDKIARDYIISKGYPTIPHSLGHGIGLEVHESPRLSPNSKDILNIGMVFTIEPGIYIPGFGGVRIEDVVVLENSGPRIINNSPKDIFQLR